MKFAILSSFIFSLATPSYALGIPPMEPPARLDGILSATWEDFEPETAKLGTEDAAPADLGVLEFEFAYSHGRAHSLWNNRWTEETRPLLEEKTYDLSIAYGLAENWELGIGLTAYSRILDRDMPPDCSCGSGIGDLEVGLKYRFYNDEDSGLSMAYLPSLTIPTGKAGTTRDPLGHSQEYWAFNQRLAVTRVCDRWTWNWDVGYSLPIGSERKTERGTFDTNAAIGYHLLPWLQPEIELNYAHQFHQPGTDSDVLSITYGAILPISDKFRVDLGFQQAIAGRNADDFTAALAAITYFY